MIVRTDRNSDRLNSVPLKNYRPRAAFLSLPVFALRAMKGIFRSVLIGILAVATLQLGAQDLWRLDSVMTTWPVVKWAQEGRKPPKQRVFPAVITDGLYEKLQKDAEGFPVFADTTVAAFADLLGEQRREQLIAVLGLAEAYFPLIEKELASAGLPEQLKYLPMAVSAMNVRGGSRSGEAGLWMLTYPVAQRYGLHVDATIDERYDLRKSTRVAVRYLKDLFAKYQDWTVATTVFACGAANVERAIGRTGGTVDYRSMYPHFTKDHREVLPVFMAMIHLAVNAKKLGLQPARIDPFEETDTLTTDREFDLHELARMLEAPYAQLRFINPTFATDRIPQGRLLHLPAGGVERLRHALLVQTELIEAAAAVMEQPKDTIATPPEMEEIERKEKEPDFTIHTVRSGESLYVIAKRYPGISAQNLKDYNGISDVIRPGQKIKIPKR